MTLEWINETGALGLDVLGIQTRALLVLWGQMSGSSPLQSYGPPQDVLPEWTTRDGIMLHSFSVWWNANHASKVAEGAGNIAVVAPDQAHLVALTQWAAEAGAQVPPLQVLDFGASRALLVLWGRTDGVSPEVLADYGVLAEDASLNWTLRDAKMLGLFQNWWNEAGKGGTLPTDGALDAQSSAALKVWFADAAGKVPSGWFAPASAPPPEKKQEQQQTPPQTCKPGEVWDEVNKACQPLPTGMTVPDEPPAGGSNTTAILLLAGGVALAGGLLWWMSKQGGLVGAGDVSANPFTLKRTDRSPGRAGMYQYGPASIWISGPVGGTWWATVKFKHQEKDFDARTLDGVLEKATRWIDEAPELRRANENPRLGQPSFIEGPGWIEARFPDGVSVNIHKGESGRYYTLRPHKKYDHTWRAATDKERRDYQAAALRAFFSGRPVSIKDRQGDLVADLKENPTFFISEIGYGTRAAANEAARRLRAQKMAYRVHVFSEKEHADADTNYIVKSWYRSEAAKQESVRRLINSYEARPFRENPSGYYVHVRGGNKETYGPYTSLQRAKTFARIGAQHGKHDRVVLRGGKVVRHYRAGTGESLVH